MKTIWIIDHYSSQPKYGGISRQYDFALELSKRGYRVIVIASSFSHFTHLYFIDKEIGIEKISDNAHYVYLKTYPYKTNGDIRRSLNMFSFCYKVLRYYKKIAVKLGEPDIVEGCSVHPLSWVAAQRIAHHFHVPFIAEVRDLWPETWILSGEKSKMHPLSLFFDAVQRWTYCKADKVIYSMLYGDRYLCDKLGLPREKVVLIGQPMDCSRYDVCAEKNVDMIPEEIRAFIQEGFVCVFTGYYMEYEGVYVMLEAAKLCEDQGLPVKMVFVGSGTERDGMIDYVKEHAIKNVYIGDRISKEAVPALLRRSDVCMAHCAHKANEKAYKYGISKNKVNEYMYAKACVIYGRTDKNDPVATSGAGYVIPPFDAYALADTIKRVYSMTPEQRKVFGENGARYVIENHRVDILTNKLLEAYGL